MEENGVMANKSGAEMMDGSNIMKLVENKQVFSEFVDHKFHELDIDGDGKLSVAELQPAVADIGGALGLPAPGTSPDSDHIYNEVLNEFTHGKQDKVSKTEFKEVLSDILVGVAAGLKRDPILILRIDGNDLLEFLQGPTFEAEILSILSEIELPDGSYQDHIIRAFEKLTVEQGMPPASDSWVRSNIIDVALQSCGDFPQQPISQEAFLVYFKKVGEIVVDLLKERPVIVAHSENKFDGNGIKSLLSNKFELDKTLNLAVQSVPKDRHGKLSKAYLRVAFDLITSSAGLPPVGAVNEVDKVVNEAIKMFSADDGKLVKEDEFKKLLTQILGGVMLQLQGNPVSVSVNSVVHEPLSFASTFLEAPSSSSHEQQIAEN